MDIVKPFPKRGRPRLFAVPRVRTNVSIDRDLYDVTLNLRDSGKMSDIINTSLRFWYSSELQILRKKAAAWDEMQKERIEEIEKE